MLGSVELAFKYAPVCCSRFGFKQASTMSAEIMPSLAGKLQIAMGSVLQRHIDASFNQTEIIILTKSNNSLEKADVNVPRFPMIRAIHIARYADDIVNSGKWDSIEPLYIRPPDAIPPK